MAMPAPFANGMHGLLMKDKDDLFEILNAAISIASWRWPEDFDSRKKEIANILFRNSQDVLGGGRGGSSADSVHPPSGNEKKMKKEINGGAETVEKNLKKRATDLKKMRRANAINQVCSSTQKNKEKIQTEKASTEKRVNDSFSKVGVRKEISKTLFGKDVLGGGGGSADFVNPPSENEKKMKSEIDDGAETVENLKQRATDPTKMRRANVIDKVGSSIQKNKEKIETEKVSAEKKVNDSSSKVGVQKNVNDDYERKFEASKRKLEQRYKEMEDGRRRTKVICSSKVRNVPQPAGVKRPRHR